MNKYDLIALRIRLKHCKTSEQLRKVIDSSPELEGWPFAKVKEIFLTDDALAAGRTIKEQQRINAMKGSSAYHRRIRMQ